MAETLHCREQRPYCVPFSDMPPATPITDELQAGRGYPRPQLRRREWTALNGEWDFAFDQSGSVQKPDEVRWTHRIRVPFSPEAPLSRIHETGFFRACWYSRQLERPDIPPGHHWLLHSTMHSLRSRLEGDEFLQLHRSIIVRRGFIDRLAHQGRSWIAYLRDGSVERISKTHVAEALRATRSPISEPQSSTIVHLGEAPELRLAKS